MNASIKWFDRELKIKITKKDHLTHVRMTYQKDNKCVGKDVEESNAHAPLVQCKPTSATTENSLEIPQKTKNWSIIWPNYFTLGYLSKEHENTNSKRPMHPHGHCSIVCNRQKYENKCPLMDELKKKMW